MRYRASSIGAQLSIDAVPAVRHAGHLYATLDTAASARGVQG
jgi:hypothetical protein